MEGMESGAGSMTRGDKIFIPIWLIVMLLGGVLAVLNPIAMGVIMEIPADRMDEFVSNPIPLFAIGVAFAGVAFIAILMGIGLVGLFL